METRKFKFKTIYIALGLPALFLIYFWYQFLLPQVWEGDGKLFEIKPGDSFMEIGSDLKSAGIIKSKISFWLLVVGHGTAGNLKAGQYFFEPGLSLKQVLAKIEHGEAVKQSKDITLTIPEGFTLREIENRIYRVGFKSKNTFLEINLESLQDQLAWLKEVLPAGPALGGAGSAGLEGFLFPDTYRFSAEDDITGITVKILNNFRKKTSPLINPDVLGSRSFYDVLIMASILEREVPAQDMPIVAGILWDRIKVGVALQADATLVYALGRPMVRADTTTLESPYNSYKFRGLPPTPISNPGIRALEAAVRPQASPYFYYLSRALDGGTVFSRTLEEHNEAKARFLR